MEQTTQGNEKALQVLNKSELLGRQFTVYGTAENPLFLAKEVAEMIGHSKTDTEWANRHGILYRQSDRWLPNAKYSGRGLFSTRTCKYVKADNTIGTSLSTVVTEKGRAAFHDFKKRLDEQERKMIIRQQKQQTVNA